MYSDSDPLQSKIKHYFEKTSVIGNKQKRSESFADSDEKSVSQKLVY